MTSLHQETSSQLAGDWKLRQLGHDVLQEVPFSETIFLRNHDVIVTCFDATKDYFVFGTNLGCSFLIERKTNHVIKILCEVKSSDHEPYLMQSFIRLDMKQLKK